jgi:cytochrome c oxidase subunit 3
MNSLPMRSRPVVFGTVLFLASEAMFFAALFAAYYDLRAGHAVWPPRGVQVDAVAGAVGTALLFAASAFMVLATRAMDHRKSRAARRWTAAAIVAAASFIVLSIRGYFENTFTPASNAYGSSYYALTGFHLLHVTAGIGLLVALLIGMRSPALRSYHREGAEAITYYWHFVFAVWVGIYVTIDLVR